MTYSNQYVLAIKDQNKKILREIDKKVYLQFNSEYSLLIKNTSPFPCLCQITIDGTDVLGGNELIVNANSSIDLERFCVDSNLNSGKRFKFVPLNNEKVQDPTSTENGIVEVKIWQAHYKLQQQNVLRCNSALNFNLPSYTTCFTPDSGVVQDSCNFVLSNSASQAGATVEGNNSNQQFFNVDNIEKSNNDVTILKLQLLGRNENVTVESKIYCGKCNNKLKFSDNWCSKCGSKVTHKI